MGMIVVYDRLTPALDGIAAQVKNTRPLMAALGREMQNTWRDHFRDRGGAFWTGIREATQLTEWDATSATVTVGAPEGAKLEHKIIFPAAKDLRAWLREGANAQQIITLAESFPWVKRR